MSPENDFLHRIRELKDAQQRVANLEGLLNNFQAGNLSQEELYQQIYGRQTIGTPSQPKKHWSSIEAMMADLAKQKAAMPPAPKPVDPARRKAEIEAELDIIRGRKPTPKGYVVDPLRAKKLMIELKQLS